jgi:superfamily I DNA/RNA helicase
LIALELTVQQRSAVDAPYDECFAIVGPPGSGKSTALAERVARARKLHPDADPLCADADTGLDDYVVSLLRSQGVRVTIIDDVEAELLFAQTCAPLFALEWDEFSANQLDPEVPGLRSPGRFLSSAFRLIRRLRDADITPARFLSRAFAGATEFYAHPPNFADPALLSATKNHFHDSLDVTPQELARQHRHELDLAKILTRLYEGYVDLIGSAGRMTGRDAVIAAADWVGNHAELASRLRARHRFAFIDEAADLTNAQLRLLRAIFGERLGGVTLCGDAPSAISTVRMTQPEATFAATNARVALTQEHRSPRMEAQRTSTSREEAELIAQRVRAWLDEGATPERIAVLFRSVRTAALYEDALLEHDIPTVVAGDSNLFEDRRALDALALLWNVHDPFRHEWLLRTLANRAVGLADASLAILCSEPPDPQRQLFAFEDEPAPTARASRWDPKRDLRLGWNVIRGERDDALSPDAAIRLQRFRSLRERWLGMMRAEPFERFALTVWREGLAREGDPGSARALAQQVVLRRLLARLNEFLAQNPGATIGDLLEYAEQRRESDLETCDLGPQGDDRGFVQMLSIEAARGREFEHVVVANVRPGAFPLWYSPEAFLFSPRLGMIPKDNVGEAHAARTAKFSYYVVRAKSVQRYNERERNAFRYALLRARASVLITASGTRTSGRTAPEFLEELR